MLSLVGHRTIHWAYCFTGGHVTFCPVPTLVTTTSQFSRKHSDPTIEIIRSKVTETNGSERLGQLSAGTRPPSAQVSADHCWTGRQTSSVLVRSVIVDVCFVSTCSHSPLTIPLEMRQSLNSRPKPRWLHLDHRAEFFATVLRLTVFFGRGSASHIFSGWRSALRIFGRHIRLSWTLMFKILFKAHTYKWYRLCQQRSAK